MCAFCCNFLLLARQGSKPLLTVLHYSQVGLHRAGRGKDIVQETRLFDESTLQTFSMRVKEGQLQSMLLFSRCYFSADICFQPPPICLALCGYGADLSHLLCFNTGLADYRYFPEPDLPPLHVADDLIEEVRVRSPPEHSLSDTPHQRCHMPIYEHG